VQDKENLGVVGVLTNFMYVFGAPLKEDQLRIALNTANFVTSNYTKLAPTVQCSYYNADGNRKEVICTSTNYKDCARPGNCIK
jgi:hypothetical protein